MQIIEGTALAKLCDYSFGDHACLWDNRLKGVMKYANATNNEFLEKAKEFEGRVMTLFIDNLRLYPREVRTDTEDDKKFVNYLMATNNLLALCSLLPHNRFIIFTGLEDTPLDEIIRLPYNVVKIYAVNAVYNNDQIIPIPFGVQRQIGDDRRLEVLLANVREDKKVKPTKLLYINCGIERSHDRDYLPQFDKPEFQSWCTTHFNKNTQYFPYERYQEFLDTIRDHKFMVCPKGHFDTMDCHRIWETFYMRRVPVVRKNLYYDKLLKDFPVLVIDEWSDLTPQLLKEKDYLFQEAQSMDMSKLDLEKMYARATQV